MGGKEIAEMPEMRVVRLRHPQPIHRRNQAPLGHPEKRNPRLPQDQVFVQRMQKDVHFAAQRGDGRKIADAL